MGVTFLKKLDQAVTQNNSLLCIGLDPVIDKLPPHIKNLHKPFFKFNKALIDATQDIVCAYKPNSAFYEARGAEGIAELKETCDYIHDRYPEIPVILDAKRGDIGSTNEGYAIYAFDYLRVGAITLHPYLGGASLTPFLDRVDRGLIILCKTSNPDSDELQSLLHNGKPLYEHVARQVIRNWNKKNNCLMVIGATYPEDLANIRGMTDEMVFLIPGIGRQGGDLGKTLTAGLNTKKRGLIISASRSVIFAGAGRDFADRARREAMRLNDIINRYRT